MTEITKTHAEWAVVDRFRAMLNEPPHAQYNVTQSYGLCLAILAWVMQRIRTPESRVTSIEDRAAISVKADLESQVLNSLPWNLQTSEVNGRTGVAEEFVGFSAFRFLVWLRDATCHGDSRQVFPINDGSILIGFEFRAAARGDIVRTIALRESELRRIGQTLASMYCRALQDASGSQEHFECDARTLRERKAA